ncbi:hypothetical protein [Nitrosospira sp. Nsp1]|uniref:hypothetical protein n=1 Tax=Nitrosospira sp. Nsp1 TaxID=136547 RepID=UPI00088EE462|nr:hypothetical protein [Nitrosospira sp. Nsp1]SCX40535.1 hypothetical protein SAMN05720354_103126 [Nitrosospira sp. Nsp1]
MKSILELQIAVMNGDKSGVHTVLGEIDRRTENEMFLRAGEHFGFATTECGGRRITFLPLLGVVFGYSDPSGLRKLVDRYDLEAYQIGAYGQNVRHILIEAFGIHKKSAHATFVTWQTFLVAGMVSTTAAADAIKLYLLQAEKAARVAAGTLEVKRDQSRFDSAAKVVNLISKAERIKDQKLREFALRHIDDLLDGALELGKQGDLFS